MATLTTQSITRAGITPTYAAVAAGGDACEVGDDIFLQVKNTNAATRTVTLAIPAGSSPYANVAFTNSVYTIAATSGDQMIGPISALYKDPTTGLCTITYSAATNVTIACIKLQAP